MASADANDVPSTNYSDKPSLDAFGPPHDHTISESLQLWIIIPGLICLIVIGKSFHIQ